MAATETLPLVVTPAARRRSVNFHFVVCVRSATGEARDLPGTDRHQANAEAVARTVAAAGLHAAVWVEKRAKRS